MAQKLKTQDLMEVFNKNLNEVNLKFDLNKEINSKGIYFGPVSSRI